MPFVAEEVRPGRWSQERAEAAARSTSVGSQHIECRESRVEFGALFAGLQVAVEETLDGA